MPLSGRLPVALQFYLREDHHRVINVLLQPPHHWRRPRGHPRTTWMRGIDTDVQSANIWIYLAWLKADGCTLWWHMIVTAALSRTCHWRRLLGPYNLQHGLGYHLSMASIDQSIDQKICH